MKKALFIFILLLLTGCGEKRDEYTAVAEFFKDKTNMSMNVLLRTDYGDRIIDFGVSYQKSPDSGQTFVVTSPEIVKGIRSSLSSDGITLEFDNTVLELGGLPGVGLSPLQSLPLMIEQWSNGYVYSHGKDTLSGKECLRITYRNTNGDVELEQHAWFLASNLTPVVSELYIDGTMTVRAVFSDYN